MHSNHRYVLMEEPKKINPFVQKRVQLSVYLCHIIVYFWLIYRILYIWKMISSEWIRILDYLNWLTLANSRLLTFFIGWGRIICIGLVCECYLAAVSKSCKLYCEGTEFWSMPISDLARGINPPETWEFCRFLRARSWCYAVILPVGGQLSPVLPG